jgi:hypothetical protein
MSVSRYRNWAGNDQGLEKDLLVLIAAGLILINELVVTHPSGRSFGTLLETQDIVSGF